MEICSRFDTESRREDLVDTDPSKQGANIVPTANRNLASSAHRRWSTRISERWSKGSERRDQVGVVEWAA